MRFLLDQDVYAMTARFLAGLGHDVIQVAQLGLSQADEERQQIHSYLKYRLFASRQAQTYNRP